MEQIAKMLHLWKNRTLCEKCPNKKAKSARLVQQLEQITDKVPSDADIEATRKLYKILDSVGIKLLDHIVASPKSAVSMKDAGYFNFFEI